MTAPASSRIVGVTVSAGTDVVELTLDFGISRDFVLSPELALEVADSLRRAVAIMCPPAPETA